MLYNDENICDSFSTCYKKAALPTRGPTIIPALKPIDDDRKVVLVVISKFRIRKHERNITSTQIMLAPITQARIITRERQHRQASSFRGPGKRTDSGDTAHHPSTGIFLIEPHGGRRWCMHGGEASDAVVRLCARRAREAAFEGRGMM
jgi:hypothetical protein